MNESAKPVIHNHFERGSIIISGGDSESAKKALREVLAAETEQPDYRAIMKASLEPFLEVLDRAFKDPSFRDRLPDLLASLNIE